MNGFAQVMNARKTVTVIGWMWVALGILAFVSGVGGCLLSTLMGKPTGPLPMRSALLDFMWQHYSQGAAIQAVFSLFIIFAAFKFLQHRPWARVGIQFISALVLAWLVFFGIYWLDGVMSFTSNSVSETFLQPVRILMCVSGISVFCVLAIVFGGMVWILSRTGIRDEFCQSSKR